MTATPDADAPAEPAAASAAVRKSGRAARRKRQGLHSAADIAAALGCSEWWVKEQARHRRIPFAWIAGSYRFTDDHLAEIIRQREVRPTDSGLALPQAEAQPPRRTSRPWTDEPPPTQLRARPPRRAVRAHPGPATSSS